MRQDKTGEGETEKGLVSDCKTRHEKGRQRRVLVYNYEAETGLRREGKGFIRI